MLTTEHYEMVIAMLTEKVKEQATEIGYLKWKVGDFERLLADMEKEQKGNGTKNSK